MSDWIIQNKSGARCPRGEFPMSECEEVKKKWYRHDAALSISDGVLLRIIKLRMLRQCKRRL